MAVKQSSTALDISSEGSPVMPSVRVLYQPKPLQQNRATAEMESAHQLVEELAGPLFQMQAVADGEAHQDGAHIFFLGALAGHDHHDADQRHHRMP